MSQVSWSSWAQVAPASSSVDRRPPGATEPASRDVASVFGQAPCCGVSTSGQIHATWSCCGCELALPPGQYGRKVRAVAVYAATRRDGLHLEREDAEPVVERRGR